MAFTIFYTKGKEMQKESMVYVYQDRIFQAKTVDTSKFDQN